MGLVKERTPDENLMEDEGWWWLQEHDDNARRHHRSCHMEYPYLTPRQLQLRRNREAPARYSGNLW